MQPVKLHFLGGASTVTGSKTLLETGDCKVLIDCGMFQGIKELRLLNWEPLRFPAGEIDAVVLTHGHLDHAGYLPRLVRQGFRGPIYATAPTLSIAEIILRDSARIHEEEAERANEEGYSSHHPALPFYDMEDVERVLDLFSAKKPEEPFSLSETTSCRFRYNGHILGACFIEMDVSGKRFVFSGDVGRRNDLLLRDPERPNKADVLILESTYGNKLHPEESIEDLLTDLVLETIRNRGTLIIPTFAVERLQLVMYILWRLYKRNRIPGLPIYIDSPMGNDVLTLFERYPNWHKVPLKELRSACNHMELITSFRDTWKAIDDERAKVVVAGSGMVTGGRVLTYLQQYADRPNTTILLVGYQAEGTRGRQLQEGAHEIKIRGRYYPVKAEVRHIESLSAHADQSGLLDWLSQIEGSPEQVFLVHGEPTALDTLRVKLKDEKGWSALIPGLNQTFSVDLTQ